MAPRAAAQCNGQERLFADCIVGVESVMKAKVTRGTPGTGVIFRLDGGRERTRSVGVNGIAKAQWSPADDGAHEVTAELDCGATLSQNEGCGDEPCTGLEFGNATCNRQGVVKAKAFNGVPGQPVLFLLDGGRPRERAFNNRGEVTAKWGESGDGIPPGPHEVTIQFACDDVLTISFACP